MRRSKFAATALAVFASAAGACPFRDQQFGNSPQGRADHAATYYPAAAEESSSSGAGRSGMNLPLDL